MVKNSYFKPFYFLILIAAALFSSCGSITDQSLFNSSSDINTETLKDIYVVNDQGTGDLYYRIKEGDVISIRNLQNITWGGSQGQSLSGGSPTSVARTNTLETDAISYIVDQNGMVALPTLKDKVKVSGLNREEARQKIEDLYKGSGLLVDPIIGLNIVNLKVTLFGEFTKPGNYYLTKDNTTLIDILGEAGGTTKNADPRTLKIIRGKEIIYVNLANQDIIGNRKLILQNNDIIRISANKNALYTEKTQRLNNIIQPLLIVVNFVALIITLSK